MIYFTSDLHLGHRGIITMRDRPFSDVDDMNRSLLRNYNAMVHKDDTVYILGDICHHMAVEEANRWIARMNGIYFALMHYPMLSWPKKNSGSIHIHGHIHSDETYNLKNREEGILRYDAGVDANQFLPVSVQQVMQFFKKG